MAAYWNGYLFVFIFLILGLLLPAGALTMGRLLRPNNPSVSKLSSYESGVEAIGEAQVRYNVRYYLFALMFVIFDVEIIFLYPWATVFNRLGAFALVETLLFIALLALGLLYAWRKKVLEWK